MPVTPSTADKSRPLVDRFALAVLALVAAVALATHGDYAGLDTGVDADLPAVLTLPPPFDRPALAGIAAALLGLLVTWRTARRVAGPVGGVIALVLLATTPLYYGGMFVGPRDAAFAAAAALLLLGLVRIIAGWPRLGMAGAVLLGLGLAATVAAWPFPPEGAEALFRGRVVDLSDPPAAYVPVLLWLKLPEIFLVLALAGLWLAVWGAVGSGEPLRRRAMLAAIAVWALLPLAVSIAVRPAIGGIGQYLFVLPPLAVAGGIAAGWVAARIGGEDRRLRAVAAAALMLGLLPPVTAMGRLHPHQHAAFNELAGGVRAIRPLYTLDGPGLSLREAAQTLAADLGLRGEAPPDGRPWRVAVCGPQAPVRAALDARFALTTQPRGADFVLMLGEFYCAGLDAPQLAPVERDGAILARVYDLRGRKVETLFMQPSQAPTPARR